MSENSDHVVPAEPPARPFERPTQCIYCPGRRIWWNGTRKRSASVEVDGRVEHVATIACARVKCATCWRSWALRPGGVVPHKHIQPAAAATALSRYLFDPTATRAAIAAAAGISPRTIGRWVAWVALVVTPARILRDLLAATGEALVPTVPEVACVGRKARSPEQADRLSRAALNLGWLEVLASARGLEPPGLQSVLERDLGQRSGLCTYGRPELPEPLSAIPEGAS